MRYCNPDQISLYLALLGYQEGESIYLTAFFNKKSPDSDYGRKGAFRGIGGSGFIKNINSWMNSRSGRGVHITVNGQGRKKDDIKFGRSLFYEHDDLPKENQIDLWKALNLPEPTLQVDSGNRSVHSYWVLDNQIPIEDWVRLQTDLLEYSDADRALSNPNRNMRLPGTVHELTGNPVEIINQSGVKYGYELLRSLIPQSQKAESKFILTSLGSSGDVPLYNFLTKDDRSLIDQGVTKQRNETGAKLARNLIGTAIRLEYLEIKYSETPEHLFLNYCHRCPGDGGWNDKEWNAIWESAKKTNPTATLTDDALENCAKSWHKNNSLKSLTKEAQASNQSIKIEPETTNKTDEVFHKNEVTKLENLIKNAWSNRLRLNQMTKQLELDGKRFKLNRVVTTIAREFDIKVCSELAVEICTSIAEDNAYHPVAEYLQNLKSQNIEPYNLDNLATDFFGSFDKLHSVYIKKTLIGAVARAIDPGCKMDTLLILQGKQGTYKSTFWDKLSGSFRNQPWFTDNISDTDKDERMKLTRYWILEYSEFEAVYKRKDVETLKNFLTTKYDSIRLPYAREIEDYPRTSIFVGTSNRTDILKDPTGARRFWIIPVSKPIPIAKIEQVRDAIWLAAYNAYRAGETWYLTEEESLASEVNNREWGVGDSWEELIMDRIETASVNGFTTVSKIMSMILNIEPKLHTRSDQMRVADILRANGYFQGRKDGVRGWMKNSEVGMEVGSFETLTAQGLSQPANLANLFQELPECSGLKTQSALANLKVFNPGEVSQKVDKVGRLTEPLYSKDSEDANLIANLKLGFDCEPLPNGTEVILGDEVGVVLKGPDDGEYQVSTPTRTTWVRGEKLQLVKALKSSARESEENKNSSQTVTEKISQTSSTNSERNSSELKTGSEHSVQVGDKVKWLTPPGKFGCPSHMEKFNPFEVIEVSPEGVHLEMVDPVRWIPFAEIKLVNSTTTTTPTIAPTTEAEPVEISVGQWVEIQSGGIYDGQKAQIIGFETDRECLYVLIQIEDGRELTFKPESLILLE